VSDESMGSPTSLKNALLRLIRSKGLVNQSAAQTLDSEWKRIVGPELGRRSTARRVRNGVVEVVVTNGAVLEELRGFVHESALSQMQASLPESAIRAIRYVRAK
jgi:predicted nucleic acid-binding Zn ribbon protein